MCGFIALNNNDFIYITLYANIAKHICYIYACYIRIRSVHVCVCVYIYIYIYIYILVCMYVCMYIFNHCILASF